MNRRRIVVASVAVALCAAGTIIGVAGADPSTDPVKAQLKVSTPQSRVGAPTATARARRHEPSDATVTLLTGDRVTLHTDADGAQSVRALPGAGGSLVTFTAGGDQYAVPSAAVPFVGSRIDPRVFDVSYLVRAHLDDAHASALPVVTTGRHGRAAPALPGQHTMRRSGASTTASLAKRDARTLGGALESRWRAAHAHRAAPATSAARAVDDVAHIALADAGSARTAVLPTRAARQPGLHYYTVTLDFTDRTGAPGSAIGFLQNVDNGNRFAQLFAGTVQAGLAQPGPVSFSVPEGNYSAAFSVVTPRPDGQVDTALVVHPQFAVHGDVTYVLDARTANRYEPTAAAVQSPTLRLDLLEFSRTGADSTYVTTSGIIGVAMGLQAISQLPPGTPPGGFGLIPTARLYASPTAPVTVGELGFEGATTLWTTPVVAREPVAGPIYYLSFPSRGRVPATLDQRVPTADLTTVRSTIHGSPTADASCDPPQLSPEPAQAWGGRLRLGGLGLQYNDVVFGSRTDYWYSADPNIEVWGVEESQDCAIAYGAVRKVTPGGSFDDVWGDAPPTPAPTAPLIYGASSAGPFLLADGGRGGERVHEQRVCTACREGNVGMLYLQSQTQTGSQQYTPDYLTTDRGLTVWRNGVRLIYDQYPHIVRISPSPLGVPMLPEAATYRIRWKHQATGDGRTSLTDWTFRSASDDATTAPTAARKCAPDPDRACNLLPLLFVTYTAPIDAASQVRGGTSVPFTVHVAHQAGAAVPTGLRVRAQFSYDGGDTWTAAQPAVASGGDAYTVREAVPAGGGFVGVRITAVDAAGNKVEQTNDRAFGISE